MVQGSGLGGIQVLSVLLIEDDEGEYRLTCDMFRDGFEIAEGDSPQGVPGKGVYALHWVKDVLEAKQSLKRDSYDVILFDISMERGLDDFLQIRDAAPEIPIVIITDHEDNATAHSALRKGAQEYLVRDRVNTEMLNRRLRFAIERHKPLTELATATNNERQFVAHVSHEIRSPITAILGFAEMILNESDLPAHVKKAAESIANNCDHLIDVVNDVLDISKVEAGKLQLESIECSPIEIIADVFSLMSIVAQKKGIELKVQNEYPIPHRIITDPTRLKQILVNLAGNAIKFTEQGSVTFKTRYDDVMRMLVVDVTDTGIGISPDKLKKIFQPFEQTDGSTSRKYGGTGLGLTIAQELAQRLGGEITVTSEVGKGSSFTLRIATGAPETVKLLYGAPSRPATGESKRAKPAVPKLTGKILVVEDGEDNRALLADLVRRTGAEYVLAENGEEALKQFAGEKFDLILMDMQMPVMDGYETTRLLRERGCGQPIVALTANAMAGSADRCLAAGCNEYLSKPFRRDEFFSYLGRYLSTRDDGAEVEPLLPEEIDDSEGFDKVLLGFLERLPDRLAKIHACAEKQDWEGLKVLAHRLAGAEMFGYPELTQVCRPIEHLIQGGKFDEVAPLVKTLESTISRIVAGKKVIEEHIRDHGVPPARSSP